MISWTPISTYFRQFCCFCFFYWLIYQQSRLQRPIFQTPPRSSQFLDRFSYFMILLTGFFLLHAHSCLAFSVFLSRQYYLLRFNWQTGHAIAFASPHALFWSALFVLSSPLSCEFRFSAWCSRRWFQFLPVVFLLGHQVLQKRPILVASTACAVFHSFVHFVAFLLQADLPALCLFLHHHLWSLSLAWRELFLHFD